MKISLNWLKKYVDINIPDDDLIRLIGARLVEVEGVIDEAHKYDNIYIVRVVSCEKIPDTHLTLCQIDVGSASKIQSFSANEDGKSSTEKANQSHSEGVRRLLPRNKGAEPREDGREEPRPEEETDRRIVQVVCGAPNVREGMLAVWIAPGAIVPASVHEDAPFVIGTRKMRGFESNGMLAGADELDFDDKHEKIAEIDPNIAKPGDALADVFNLHDKILEIENKSLTHRPDCFGIIGFAREVAGILGQKFNEPDFLWQENVFSSDFLETKDNSVKRKNTDIKINITDKELCPRYTCAVAKVTDAVESSKYLSEMQILLAKSGMHSISKIVDVTNYLMLLTGQPLHAFDYDKFIAVGKTETPSIIIRAAKNGENITLLDDTKAVCNENDILITSNDIPVALAGAMGGKSTAINEDTKNILIESATFSLYNLRKTQMAHGIFSEAITRFTKGVPAGGTYNVLTEAIKEMNVKPLDLNDSWPGYSEGTIVKITTNEINSLLGTDYNTDLIKKTLENVGFSITSTGGAAGGTPDARSRQASTVGETAATGSVKEMTISKPMYRTDIHIKEDIIEEVGRLLGYDNITPTLPLHQTAEPNALFNLKHDIRNTMLRFGANELLTYSFISDRLLEKSNQDAKNSYKIVNSISPDLQYVRQSIVPSLLDKAYMNEKLPVEEFAIYEMNQVYQKSFGLNTEKVPNYQNHLGLVVAKRKSGDTAFYQAKKYIDELLNHLGVEVDYLPLKTKAAEFAPFEAKRSAEIVLKSQPEITLGIVGEFKNSVKNNFKLANYLAGAEVNLDIILNNRLSRKINLNKPQKTEDITITTEKTYAEELKNLQEKYKDAVITPGTIYQAKGQTSKNITFHLYFYQAYAIIKI